MRTIPNIKTKIKSYVENLIFAKRFGLFRKRVLIIGTPEYNNVGDSLLTMATLKLFYDFLNEYCVVEITRSEYYRYYSVIKNGISKRDIITFQPGGNMGNVWQLEENCRRAVIQSFPDNKVVILPQTVYYEDNDEGKESLENSKIIYSSHKNLIIVAREQISYSLMREYYPNNKVMLVPDMALYLSTYRTNIIRKGVFLCLRNDSEKSRAESDDETILSALGTSNYQYMDMYSDENPNIYNRINVVYRKIDEFTKAELVITDRLHGMVCCAITETPCVVLSNNHHKVKGVYEWIKDLPYIEYVESIENIREAIRKVISTKERHYDNTKFLSYYEKLIKEIEGV